MIRWIVFAAFAAFVTALSVPNPLIAPNVAIAALVLGWAVHGSSKR